MKGRFGGGTKSEECVFFCFWGDQKEFLKVFLSFFFFLNLICFCFFLISWETFADFLGSFFLRFLGLLDFQCFLFVFIKRK